MAILLILIPISFGILSYIFKKHHRKIGFITYAVLLSLNTYLTFFGNEERIFPGGWDRLKGIEIYFPKEMYILAFFFNIMMLIIYWRSARRHNNIFTALWLIINGTLIGILTSEDFFNTYVHLELISISSFLLIGLGRKERRIWASLKYMFLSYIGLNFYLLGVGLIYAQTGSLNLHIAFSSKPNPLAVSLIVTGLLVKSGMLFLAAWLPAVYTESSSEISAILSGYITPIGTYVLYSFSLYDGFYVEAKEIFLIYGFSSLILGGILAFFENDAKKILAYSTMSQIGLALIIIAEKKELFILFFILQMLYKSLAFYNVGRIYEKTNYRNLDLIKTIKKYDINKMLAIFSIFGLSGIFPTQTFFIKENIGLHGYLKEILYISSFITTFYSIKLIAALKLSKKYFYLVLLIPIIPILNYLPMHLTLIDSSFSLLALIIAFFTLKIKTKAFTVKLNYLENALILQTFSIIIGYYIIKFI
ncbi:multisubunit sodium/proton antiporter, MrpD subunit [Marinitoga hydrogenitolerans DSM 16785]|uniref:Multisubunit sodium/proton antiporter, MrpD subunit n=1 Tax=Marinitoga hydrogenitolerans (strain DSM 16785 / JCM 12826 / AT1271) TaxID=1122195 RepID=A0A1M4SM54_MARH1|nr:proton-conducting transporter membrane subunit [Marinitoga hydrogenitolerans]SHE33291.1 multisubunit sodium/proton antiporter, MrpD subunit [Marinitoga hydrogenitolerans DSM 16785]